MEKILITGSTGFIGKRLVQRLMELGYDCRCMVRDLRKAREYWGEAVDIVEGEITSPDSVAACVSGCTHVVHLAAQIGSWSVKWPRYKAINIDGTRNVVAACSSESVELLVYCSTAGVVGVRGCAAANEETSCRPRTPYEASKLEGERLVNEAVEQARIRAIIARLDFVYGPDDMRRLPLYAMIRRGRFFLVGKGDALIRPTYVDDAADGLVACLNHPEYSGQTFNIGGPEQVSAREFIQTIQQKFCIKRRVVLVPRPFAYAGALASEGISRLIAREPMLTVSRVRFWSMHHSSSVQKAQHLLDFRAGTPLSEGMSKTISWFGSLAEPTQAHTKLFE